MLKKFIVKSVLKYGEYCLVDEEGKDINLCFQFYELPSLIEGDEICFDEKLADKNFQGFTQPYSFIKSSEQEIASLKLPREEVGGIRHQKEKFFIRRIFG